MKIKKQKNVFIGLLVFCLLSTYVFLPPVLDANAIDSISDAKDLMSDTDPYRVATHTFTFTTGTTTPSGGSWVVTFPTGTVDDFSTVLATNATFNGDGSDFGVPSDDGNGAITADATAPILAGEKTIVVTGVTNPESEGTQYILIELKDAGDVTLERVTVAVAIIEDVLMTARVESTLTFAISGIANGETVNNVTCNAPDGSTATTTPFGTLALNTPTTVCQGLSVASNAVNGYSVTVWADGELTSDGGANINSFNNALDDQGLKVPLAWTDPTSILDQYHTYGHMGLTSQDSTLDATWWDAYAGQAVGSDPFGVSLYVGFQANEPIQVMYHTGPTVGDEEDFGQTSVAYTAHIESLQEAGDYEATLTYVCTPVY